MIGRNFGTLIMVIDYKRDFKSIICDKLEDGLIHSFTVLITYMSRVGGDVTKRSGKKEWK